MKILLISNMYPSETHAMYGVFVKNFVNQVSSSGFVVAKIVIEGRGRGVFGKLKKYFRFVHAAVSALHHQNYDLVYVHYIGHSMLPFLLTKTRINKPFVINAHGGDVFASTGFGRVIQKLVTPVVQKANLVVVPSEYFSCVVEEKYSIPRRKIFISPSGGVDGKLFKPSGAMNKSSSFVLGYVSRIDEGKGWDTLLLAANRLVLMGLTNLQVLMVGDGAQVGLLKEMVTNYGLSDYVRYVGPIPHDELPAYYHQMDLFVFPTRLPESLGLVGLEALSCGVPVVGSNIGGLAGYITPGVNGQLFPPGDDEALADCIKTMMSLDSVGYDSYKANAAASSIKYESGVVAEAMKTRLEKVVHDFRVSGA